jgi:hypothetical protein
MAVYVGDRSRKSARQLWKRIPQAYRDHATLATDDGEACKGIIPSERPEVCAKGSGRTNIDDGSEFSPDGKWIVFISFPKDIAPGDHPFCQHVYLRLMPIEGGKPKVIAYLYGGQGTINVPSWSPDSKKIAFVSNTEIK